ncbi:MAG TPA: hypothetical protein PLQ93_12745 [Bacteroidia bacterium]|nr:hypothetical protein [Bacteroidia bacterium]
MPALLEKGFYSDSYDKDFDHRLGDGFYFEDGKVTTKFSCGLALLQFPFYTLGAAISKLFSIDASPWSAYYLFFINVGAAFYLTAGICFFRKWLARKFSQRTTLYTVLLTFFGTNLLYYATDETLMSHLYSFVLASSVLYFLQEYFFIKKWRFFIGFAICLSLAILVRPTNLLFLPFALISDTGNFGSKLRRLFALRNVLAGSIVLFIVILPQMHYWKFAFGSYLIWSYKGEGFYNWDHPDFFVVWFSPRSGLFPYSLLLLLSLFTAVFMLLKKVRDAWAVLIVFFGVSYLCAAWVNPFFGVCNYGKRPFVEYLPFLALPLAWLIENMQNLNTVKKRTLSIVLILLVYYNLALYSAFNTCYSGNSDWDFMGFLKMFSKGLTIIR